MTIDVHPEPLAAAFTPTEDFWGRRAHAPRAHWRMPLFGQTAEISSNQPELLEAARLSALRFSQGPPEADGAAPLLRVQLVVRESANAVLPDDWPARLQYAGTGPWITVSAGEDGHGFGHLDTREAVVFLAPAVAAQTRLVSRYFIDHYLLNFLFAEWAMLHASAALHPNGRALVLMIGAHNAGKSTTALRLLRAGWSFLADGMALLRWRAGGWQVGGYPIGQVKLRDEALAGFPELAAAGPAVRVREQNKTVVDLRATHPHGVAETVLTPASVHLGFVERTTAEATRLAPLSREAASALLAAHTVFWDTPARLAANDLTLAQLLASAHPHRLSLGSDPEQLIRTLETLG